MKTEIIKQINIKFEKDEKELIKKVAILINDLIDKGIEYEYDRYEINNIYREKEELENLVEILTDLTFGGVVELI